MMREKDLDNSRLERSGNVRSRKRLRIRLKSKMTGAREWRRKLEGKLRELDSSRKLN